MEWIFWNPNISTFSLFLTPLHPTFFLIWDNNDPKLYCRWSTSSLQHRFNLEFLSQYSSAQLTLFQVVLGNKKKKPAKPTKEPICYCQHICYRINKMSRTFYPLVVAHLLFHKTSFITFESFSLYLSLLKILIHTIVVYNSKKHKTI